MPSLSGSCARRVRVILGEDKSQRMGEFPRQTFHQWMVVAWRTDPQSLHVGSFSLRFLFGIGRVGGGEFMLSRGWNGNRWLDHLPSQTNGIVGIKPTLGLVSRSGIIPIAHSQDTAGPMARTVADAAILLGAMIGVDERDSATRLSRKRNSSNYTKYLDLDGLKGARIGVARNMAGTNPRVLKIFDFCIEVLRNWAQK